jgi:hypothetical protein
MAAKSDIGRRARRLGVLALAALLAACNPPVRQYELKRQALSCDEANRFAYETLKAMGFSIDELQPASLGGRGVLKGTRTRSAPDSGVQHVTVTVRCTPAGADIDAGEDGAFFTQVDFKRGFHDSFTSVVSMSRAREQMNERIAAGTAPASQQRHDLQVEIEPLTGHEGKLHFQFDLPAAGVLPVRLHILNLTDRRYAFDPAEVRLTRADRRRVRALSAAQAASRVAAARGPSGEPVTELAESAVARRLQSEQVAAVEVKPGDDISGYLYFPLADYERARVVLTDAATGEAEGVLVEF